MHNVVHLEPSHLPCHPRARGYLLYHLRGHEPLYRPRAHGYLVGSVKSHLLSNGNRPTLLRGRSMCMICRLALYPNEIIRAVNRIFFSNGHACLLVTLYLTCGPIREGDN